MNIKQNANRPFELAQIEIVDIVNHDVLTVSGFWGDEEDLDTAAAYYWERNQ